MRQRTFTSLFAGAALGTTGLFAAFTVAPLIAAHITGSPALSGVPGAAAVLGTALGAALVTSWSRRRGRRLGLSLGYAVGAVGGVIAVAAAQRASFALLALGMVVLGIGHSSNQLARYAAGDQFPSSRRASVMGWIIWAGTIGALAGPNLVAPAERAAERLGLTGLAGGYLVVALFFAAAAVLLAFAIPSAAALAGSADRPPPSLVAPVRLSGLLRGPLARAAALAMVVGQSVMILVMTVTPVHLGSHGQGLKGVGLVMSAHLVGMYVFAPIGGRIADRVGSLPVILAGQALLALSALLAAASRPTAGGPFLAALLLLGVGWSLGLVGGSSLLTRGLDAADAVRLQGATESLIWIAAAGASVASGLLLSARGYVVLCVAAACLTLLPIATIVVQRRSLAHAVAH